MNVKVKRRKRKYVVYATPKIIQLLKIRKNVTVSDIAKYLYGKDGYRQRVRVYALLYRLRGIVEVDENNVVRLMA